MRILLQRVREASVQVDSKTVGSISHGYVLFVGITHSDTPVIAEWLVEKIVTLRLFGDEKSFLQKNIQEVTGELLIVSQFTLYGETKKGTRPSFTQAAKPEQAKELYEYLIEAFHKKGMSVSSGIFGADMNVALVNDGPVTLMLEK